MALTRADVVAAALRLLDARGLDGVTLRAVAAELGVQAPTLYWHVQDKRHLLDLMAEQMAVEHRLLDRSLPAPGEPVWAWLADRLRSQRAALLRHPDVIHIVAGNLPTVDALPAIERALGVLVGAGLPPAEASRLIQALGAYVLGDVLETQAAVGRNAPPELADAVISGPYPLLRAAVEGGREHEARFEEGLGLLMTGVRARLAAPAAGGPAAGGPAAAADREVRR